jgi:osmotically-inducible protein OsmY
MKNNEDLQKDVQNAIKWEPLLNAAEIGVTAKDGVISLTGVVDSYTKKLQAENAAKNVAGVKAVVEKIEIKFSSSWNKSNVDIANEVLNALKGRWDVPSDKIKVKVEDGWVTLDGEFPWNYQRQAAQDAVNYLNGVKGITNNIMVKPETNEEIEKKNLEAALASNWSLMLKNIVVNVRGNNVRLTGTVDSIYQKEEAERIAWRTPGIWTVDNDLVVEYDYSFAD